MSHRDDIRRLLGVWRPRSILSLGPDGSEPFRDYAATNRDLRLVTLALGEARARLPELGRFELAYVSGALEALPKSEGRALLARLRDVHAQRLLVAVAFASSAWEANELLALGLACVRAADAPDPALYAFDIEHYKLTPDWLNSNHWANPELFDKFRW